MHPEHDLGAQSDSANDEADPLDRPGEGHRRHFGLQLAKVSASRSAINAELLKGATFRTADITFEHDSDLDLGGVHAQLTAMGANRHTKAGDTIIWIDADRVLFAGDLAISGRSRPSRARIRA